MTVGELLHRMTAREIIEWGIMMERWYAESE